MLSHPTAREISVFENFSRSTVALLRFIYIPQSEDDKKSPPKIRKNKHSDLKTECVKTRESLSVKISPQSLFFFFFEKTPIKQARASQAAEQTLVSVKSSSVITAVALLSNRGSNGWRSLRKHRSQLSVCCLANLSEVKI